MAKEILCILVVLSILLAAGCEVLVARSKLSTLSHKMSDEAENIDFSEPATADRPITIVRHLKLVPGKKMGLKIGFFNSEGVDLEGTVPEIVTCVYSQDGTELAKDGLPVLLALPENVPIEESVMYTAFIQAPDSMPAGESVCTVRISRTIFQIFVDVP